MMFHLFIPGPSPTFSSSGRKRVSESLGVEVQTWIFAASRLVREEEKSFSLLSGNRHIQYPNHPVHFLRDDDDDSFRRLFLRRLLLGRLHATLDEELESESISDGRRRSAGRRRQIPGHAPTLVDTKN